MEPLEEAMSGVRWLEPAESPFGIRVLDCRSLTQTVTAVTQDQAVAESYCRLRGSQGLECRGQVPEGADPIPCDLRYAYAGAAKDGPLFKAQQMEVKWDIYLHEGFLYFCRSWTGELVFRAGLAITGREAAVSGVEATTTPEDPSLPVREVDFLIKSHIFGQEAPHPLPASLRPDPREIALYSFSRYGRRALYGSFEDTTRRRT